MPSIHDLWNAAHGADASMQALSMTSTPLRMSHHIAAYHGHCKDGTKMGKCCLESQACTAGLDMPNVDWVLMFFSQPLCHDH